MKRVTSSMNPNTPWRRPLAIPVVAGLFTLASILSGAAGPAFAACPSSQALGNFKASNNVAADFSNTGNVTTYVFSSLTDENPVNGVPGLIAYCVYPSPAQPPTKIEPKATGADGSAWITRQRRGSPPWLSNRQLPPGNAGFGNFSFVRPRGNPSNIPLDGKSTVVGTATWSDLPTAQTILLHIADPTVCASLYGGTEGTCFVKPTVMTCDLGPADLTGVAYSSIPRDAVNCGPPSHAFEATSTREFGDRVGLAFSGTLKSLTVLFSSYACEDHPWYTTQCYTAPPGNTFTHTIKAHIYLPSDLVNPIATATQSFAIPYRPSADTVNCGTTGRFLNPISGNCEYSIKTLLTFTNWDLTPSFSAGQEVVWTVEFNTSDYGATPLRPQPCNSTTAGCPYDSLNVGTKTYDGAPYRGTDVDTHEALINSTWKGIYCDDGFGGTGFLRSSTNPPTPCTNIEAGSNYSPTAWLGYTPLATITLQ